ncbi:MAG: methionyl-tRNA formyltransferase, partial [Sphingobacteriia bacterium]
MGTPDFAVASLAALVDNGFQVVGVVTAPDRPAGRGLQLKPSAVKEYAVSKNLALLQPEKLRDPGFQNALLDWNADLQVVVAFRMLPESVWNMPPLGTINVHGSLLPDYRGAAPINWAVINGEKKTGVTTFKLQHAIDTGDILLQATMDIGPAETATSVHDRMKILGADTLVKTLMGLQQQNLVAKPQILSGLAKHAPKIFTTDCELDFTQPVLAVFNRVRGLAEFPGAMTQLEG